MPISDPRDRFFYLHDTFMKDTYNLRLCKNIIDIEKCELHVLMKLK